MNNQNEINIQIEILSAKFHEIYLEEQRRQGISHESQRWNMSYSNLPENLKDFDRALARYVLEQFFAKNKRETIEITHRINENAMTVLELVHKYSLLQKENQMLIDGIYTTKLFEILIQIIDNYCVHDQLCILSQWQQGEPTADGGYRTMYAGTWYQSRPIDETPKCDCGLNEALVKWTGRK